MDEALIKWLEKKDFEYITIKEICAAAGVNRSTFYLHYETVGDLLQETTRYLLDDFLAYFSTDTKAVALKLMDCELSDLIFVCDKYLSPYLTYIKDHKEIFGTVLLYNQALGFEDVYKRMFDNIFNPILERFHYDSGNRQYIILYYLNGINAIILEWLRNGCDMSIQEISEIISICIYGKDSTNR